MTFLSGNGAGNGAGNGLGTPGNYPWLPRVDKPT